VWRYFVISVINIWVVNSFQVSETVCIHCRTFCVQHCLKTINIHAFSILEITSSDPDTKIHLTTNYFHRFPLYRLQTGHSRSQLFVCKRLTRLIRRQISPEIDKVVVKLHYISFYWILHNKRNWKVYFKQNSVKVTVKCLFRKGMILIPSAKWLCWPVPSTSTPIHPSTN
jgi:hypothetical protein